MIAVATTTKWWLAVGLVVAAFYLIAACRLGRELGSLTGPTDHSAPAVPPVDPSVEFDAMTPVLRDAATRALDDMQPGERAS